MTTPHITGAGGFFYNPNTHEVFLHLRDGNTPNDPHKWACFGGQIEGAETPTECCIREWREELNLVFDATQLHFLMHFDNARGKRHALFFIEATFSKSDISLGEGTDCAWVHLDDSFTLDLSTEARAVLAFFQAQHHYH